MNERIRELAEQANMQYVIKISDDNEDIMCIECDNGFPTAKQFEKFAELIVRECLNMIENEAVQYAEPVWAIELVNDIKDHFGVE
jgi:hypothetical protein